VVVIIFFKLLQSWYEIDCSSIWRHRPLWNWAWAINQLKSTWLHCHVTSVRTSSWARRFAGSRRRSSTSERRWTISVGIDARKTVRCVATVSGECGLKWKQWTYVELWWLLLWNPCGRCRRHNHHRCCCSAVSSSPSLLLILLLLLALPPPPQHCINHNRRHHRRLCCSNNNDNNALSYFDLECQEMHLLISVNICKQHCG